MTQPTRARAPFGRIPAPLGPYHAYLEDLQTRLEQAQRPQTVKTVRDDYIPTVDDQTVLVDPAGGAITITLRDPERVLFGAWTIKQVSAGTVTVVGTIDGVVDPVLGGIWKAITIQSDGTTYVKLAAV